MNRLQQLLTKLSLTKENGLFLLSESESWIHKFPYRVSRILQEVIKPDALFCLYGSEFTKNEHPQPFNQNFILFFDNPSSAKEDEIHKNVINFGLAQAVFILKEGSTDIFHGNDFSLQNLKLNKLQFEDLECAYQEFSFANLLRGRLTNTYKNSKGHIDEYLLRNITDARRILVAKNGLKLLPKAANRLIGRLLFISYLIDRNVKFSDQNIITGDNKIERRNSFRGIIQNKNRLYSLFKYLNKKYNGDMFPLKERVNGKIYYDEESIVESKHLEVLSHLFNCAKFFKSGEAFMGYSVQESLFNLYDFEIIPVELISSIYENFIGNESENDKLQLTKQKTIKAYYTPPYLVDYVLSQTVVPFLRDNNTVSCKVLDPACGSGIFLVETLRKLVEKEIYVTKKEKITDSRLWKLIKSNIFGIDIDSDAIDITIFSIYITILDYKLPAEIEKFKFQKLKKENFFGGIEADFFNTNHIFNSILPHLDFIIGNPPWGQVAESCYLNYIQSRNLKEKKESTDLDKIELQIGDKEICQAFILRTSDFAAPNRKLKCSFIVSSKVLYNSEGSSKIFRNYFLNKFHIHQVVELSPVNNKIRGGSHIFENARQPAAVITFTPEVGGKTTSQNRIQHITVKPNRFFTHFKTILVEKHDVKNILQHYFMPSHGGHDWLWKVLVHGSILDVYFLKRLRDENNFKPISHELKNRSFEYKGGVKLVDGQNKVDSEVYQNYNYLNAEKEFRPFIAHANHKWKTHLSKEQITDFKIGYLPEEKFFNGTKLLIKKGLVLKPRSEEHHFQAVTALHTGKLLFSSTVCSIIPPKNTSADGFINNLVGLFNSKLFTYFLLNTSSSAGIERTRIHFKEFFEFPFVESNVISKRVLEISNLASNWQASDFRKQKDILDNTVNNSFKLSNIEESLIDYAINIAIPYLLREEDNLIFKSINLNIKQDLNYMVQYIDILKESFTNMLNSKNKSIKIEVLYTEFFIRINFVVIQSRSSPPLCFKEVEDNNMDILLGDLGIYEVCKDLYFQQDVRGFTPNSFYIIKPNERKLWHNSVAYLDVLEFQETILKSNTNF